MSSLDSERTRTLNDLYSLSYMLDRVTTRDLDKYTKASELRCAIGLVKEAVENYIKEVE